MTTYGITPQGFYRKDFLTCFDEISGKYKAKFGNELKITGDSVSGNLIGISAELDAIQWEQLQAVQQSAYRQTASDEALDNACQWIAVSRILARHSTVQTATLTNNSNNTITIPSASLVKQSSTGVQWQTLTTVIIPANSIATVSLKSVETGPFTAEIDSINEIVSLIPGWSEITNNSIAIVGRDRETDAELRIRADNEIISSKGGVGAAIANRIRTEVSGVTFVDWEENRTDIVDNKNLLPHSYHFIVVGGTDSDIVNKILESKSGGISTNGNISIDVTDNLGNTFPIKFDRAYNQDIYLIVNITKNSEFPIDYGSDLVKKLLVDYGKTLGNGNKVINHYLLGSLNVVPGIDELTILQGTSPTPVSSANITISSSNKANIIASNIVVNIL